MRLTVEIAGELDRVVMEAELAFPPEAETAGAYLETHFAILAMALETVG